MLAIEGLDVFDAWKACRDVVDETGLWPVVTELDTDGSVWFAGLPGQTLGQAEAADVDGALERLADRSLVYQTLEEAIENERADVESQLGRRRGPGAAMESAVRRRIGGPLRHRAPVPRPTSPGDSAAGPAAGMGAT
ncbi:MAG TPA: hypothetical protein VGG06_34705, partial [Thermoanaerobaculia bacterium]